MTHTLKKIASGPVKGTQNIIDIFLLSPEEKVFYIFCLNDLNTNEFSYILFEDIEDLSEYMTMGERRNNVILTRFQYLDDNYLISLFIKDFAKFSDQDLIQELKSRGYTGPYKAALPESVPCANIDTAIEQIRKAGVWPDLFLTNTEVGIVIHRLTEASNKKSLAEIIIEVYTEGLPF